MFAVGITNMIFFFCHVETSQYPAIRGEREREGERMGDTIDASCENKIKIQNLSSGYAFI